jgi:hypothetical protein
MRPAESFHNGKYGLGPVIRSSRAGRPVPRCQDSYRNICFSDVTVLTRDTWVFENEIETGEGFRSWDLPKAITGRPSSARHKLSDPFRRASRSPPRRYQLLRARADSHEPRILQAALTSHAPSGHGGHPCPAEPKMGDLSKSVLRPLAKASPDNRC